MSKTGKNGRDLEVLYKKIKLRAPTPKALCKTAIRHYHEGERVFHIVALIRATYPDDPSDKVEWTARECMNYTVAIMREVARIVGVQMIPLTDYAFQNYLEYDEWPSSKGEARRCLAGVTSGKMGNAVGFKAEGIDPLTGVYLEYRRNHSKGVSVAAKVLELGVAKRLGVDRKALPLENV